ncbi:MAG: CBS domain-containing protein [Bacteroidia bacterium]
MTSTLPKELTAHQLARFPKAYLLPTASVAQARKWLQKHQAWRHIPIVSEDKRFIGLLPKNALRNASPTTSLETLPLLTEARIYLHATVYDILREIHRNRLRALGVVDESGVYYGIITPYELVNWWANLLAVKQPGGTLLLECATQDYSLAQIAYIVEAEGLKILSAYILDHNTDYTRLRVILRLSSSYFEPIKETLRRHGYEVLTSYADPEEEKVIRQRLDALLRYLQT